jgi:hypothetical protein
VIISPNSIHELIFAMRDPLYFCEVGTEFLNIIQMSFVFRGLIYYSLATFKEDRNILFFPNTVSPEFIPVIFIRYYFTCNIQVFINYLYDFNLNTHSTFKVQLRNTNTRNEELTPSQILPRYLGLMIFAKKY